MLVTRDEAGVGFDAIPENLTAESVEAIVEAPTNLALDALASTTMLQVEPNG
jgi:hypothetical protein